MEIEIYNKINQIIWKQKFITKLKYIQCTCKYLINYKRKHIA